MTATVDRGEAYRIFSAALDLVAERRNAFVRERCGSNADLERKVLDLLAAADPGSDATGVLLGGAEAPLRDLVGAVYGQFRLVELIGAGGMGVVYRAERTDGVPQAVAVKLLRGEISAASSARFVSEAKLLARLEHPAIARLIDVGVRDGEGWIALELVRGTPIDAYCDAHALETRAQVRLLVTVVDAVAAAHHTLVVHRDIKPTNVLVTEAGNPKLIDFGIASALTEVDESPESAAAMRRSFTPHYAAPEQTRGEPVTVATDVFGLGALAYRLLTGVPPFAEAKSAVGYLHAVASTEVLRPSDAATPARARALRGDLDSILMCALKRDPALRYSSAQDLQADLQRYLDGLPVAAHPPGFGYRAAKFVRRHALPVGFATLLALGLVAGGAVYGLQERRVALARDGLARRGEFLERLLRSADPREGHRDITVAELLDTASRGLDQSLGKEPRVEASMLGLIVDTNTGLGRYPEALAASDRQLALLEAYGGDDRELAQALISRGELLRADGHYADGLPVMRKALALLQPLSGVDAESAAALNELGMLLANSGGEKEAEAVFRQSIALWRRASPDSANAGAALQNLAVLLGNEGRYGESATVAHDALTLLIKYMPADHPDLMTTEQTGAMALLNLHRAAEAEPLLRDIIARSTRIRGAEHADTLAAQTQLGEVLLDLGRNRDAAAVLRPTAESLDRVLGPAHRYATATWNDYAVAACNSGDAVEGLDVAHRIADLRVRTLPADDWHILGARTTIGICLVRMQRYAEADKLLTATVAALEASRGPKFYTTQLAYAALRDLYASTGRPANAERIAAKLEK